MAVEDGEGTFFTEQYIITLIGLRPRPKRSAIGAAFEHCRESPEDASEISRILKQVQAVRYDRVNFAQVSSRAALNHHFELPPEDDILKDIAAGDPMVALVPILPI